LALLLCWATPLSAATQLVPVVTGLSSPVFVGHAGDGSNRLFIVEQGGAIRVVQPGGSTATVFLDINSRVLSGGERGLLGLAFHPQYGANGRFFVFYTRNGDGALVIAEYRVSSNPNVADNAETVLLTIPHPSFSNHNGGMIAFGFDGFLYIGTGDGGSGNDPPNNAQNIESLLGKILRINVNSGSPYSSPGDNPYVGVPGRDEIFAIGLRNPWRFSFDRITGQMWVGDVGQGAREEVNTPIVKGGNYGWRVFEGSLCTGLDASLCNSPANFIPPVFDYTHGGGRCSVTGGYAYRGSSGTFQTGSYLYADYCTGEVFLWDGSSQQLVLNAGSPISSFGEDQQGELYVVNHGGSISRLAESLPCTYAISPTAEGFGAGGGTGSIQVTARSGCAWSAGSSDPWIHVTAGAAGSGDGVVSYTVDVNSSISSRSGTLTVAGQGVAIGQNGTGPCSFAVSPLVLSFTKAGGTGSVNVSTSPGCLWTSVSNAYWISITTPATRVSSGTVSFFVSSVKPRNRVATLTVAGQTVKVR
jgi:glucose/arabinose dehydrogenase